jgi:glutaredoxin
MDIKHVDGRNEGKILLYALSTCVWCKKTKKLLNELGVAYDYIDVDLLEEKEKEKIKQEVIHWNPKGSYPTIVIDAGKCITGFDEKKIREVLGNEK